MIKKIVLSVLLVTVIGAGIAAVVYQSGTSEAAALVEPLASSANDARQPVAQGSEGLPWQAVGTVLSVDDYGFDLLLADGSEAYVELGPPDFWQAQGIDLQPGQAVSVDGFDNEGMYHAVSVALAQDQVLTVRSEAGQPLWSGGVTNAGGQGDGTHTPDPKAQVDEWVTVSGSLLSFSGGQMTIGLENGELVSFQAGQPRFFAGQGVTFQVGDVVEVVGFYDGSQFVAGEITRIESGETVMLRDPNGRPLWAGPGNGSGNGGGGPQG